MSTWYNSENNTIPMFYDQKMVNEIDTAKFADVGCNCNYTGFWIKNSIGHKFLSINCVFLSIEKTK